MLYFTILYYIMLCYIILYYIVLCYIMLYYTILYYIVLYYIVLCYIILYYIILYCIVLWAFLRTRVNGRVNGFWMVYACARNRVTYHLLDEKTKFGKKSQVNAFSLTRGLDDPSHPRVNEPSPTKCTDTHPLLHIL